MPTFPETMIAITSGITCTVLVIVLMRDLQQKRIVSISKEHHQEMAIIGRVYEQRLQTAVSDERKSNQLRMRDLERHWHDRLEAQSKLGLSVVLYPFVNTTGERGLFVRESKIEVGYKYQLHVQGLPCFEPHTIVVETTQHKEIREEMVEALKLKALQFAQTAIDAKASGGANMLFSIAKAVVSRAK